MMADLLANRMQQQEILGFIFLFWLLNFLVWVLRKAFLPSVDSEDGTDINLLT